VRLVEALLPLLRASAPSAIVNVASTAGRIGRPGAGAYSASKAAFAVWSDSLRAEEHPYGVHVGTVMPGFIPTEGFPQRELAEKRTTRWMLGTPEQAAEAIADAGLGRRAERYVPRFYGGVAALRTVAPGLVRRVLASGRADVLATKTRQED
jgi:short-subunit dehydrogenase